MTTSSSPLGLMLFRVSPLSRIHHFNQDKPILLRDEPNLDELVYCQSPDSLTGIRRVFLAAAVTEDIHHLGNAEHRGFGLAPRLPRRHSEQRKEGECGTFVLLLPRHIQSSEHIERLINALRRSGPSPGHPLSHET